MKISTKLLSLFFLCAAMSLVFTSCEDDDVTETIEEADIVVGADAAVKAQTLFIDVADGEEITFGEGVFSFTGTLSMDGKNGIVIKGAGKDKTILDFSGQTDGGEGVLITNSDNIRVEGITIRDSAGDALKARDCDKISFIDVGTVWSGEPNEDNGAYGLYPVLCTEVYIDNAYAYGAEDAGIYVGQSDQIIIKNSVAEGNVAGIEIENSTNADVFDNEAFDNTGGILIFDLPGLSKSGKSVRVFNNNCHDNNRVNFGNGIVGSVPAGTGVMVLSTKDVEIFDNTIIGNDFSGVMVVNYLIIESNITDPTYNPVPSGIYIHDNTYKMTGVANIADQTSELIQQLMWVVKLNQLSQPDVLLDGLLFDAQQDLAPGNVCIQEAEGTSFINMNAWHPTFDFVTGESISDHDCEKERLPAVSFEPA